MLMCVFADAAATPESDYLAMREAFRSGESGRVNSYAARLKGHALEPFAVYLQLVMRIREASPEEIRNYITRNADSHFSDKLRADWLRALGKNQEWELFLGEYPQLINQDNEITCYELQARLAKGDDTALTEAKKMWLTG